MKMNQAKHFVVCTLAVLFSVVILLISTVVCPKPAFAQGASVDAMVSRLSRRNDGFQADINRWKITLKTDANYLDPHFIPDAGWKSIAPGTHLLKSESGAWLWAKYRVPEMIGGMPLRGGRIQFLPIVMLSADIYINGVWKGNTYGRQGEFLVTDNAIPGEEYVFVIHEHNRYGDGMFLKAGLIFIPQKEIDREVNVYLNDVMSVRSLIGYAPDKAHWQAILERSAAAVDLDAFDKKDFARFASSLNEARRLLEPAREFTRQFSVFLLGYSHIDLAYRWDKREGEEVWYNTARTILDLLNRYPDWTYCAGQAAGYQYMEKRHPEIFSKIRKSVSAGRWEPVGGMWVEPDSNLPGGESFVRQLLYGKRWFRQKLGKDVVVAWTPDSFGFNWNLAQIYKKAGIIAFYTQKIGWNDTNVFPYHIFWWEGPDGSRILTYLPPTSYAASLDTEPILDHLKELDHDTGMKQTLELYGVGDHGGGVTLTSLDRAFAFRKDAVFSKTSFTTADAFFKHLVAQSKIQHIPVYRNELYLEYHRGTYTTQSNTKRNNRRGEAELADAELLSTIAAMFGRPYPRNEIHSAWDILLLNQFHDILPGSGVNKVYKDADKDYATLFVTTASVSGSALRVVTRHVRTSGRNEALVVFNTLPWVRDAIVNVDTGNPESKTVIDPKNKTVMSQAIGAPGRKHLLFVAKGLPASGYAVYRLIARAPVAKAGSLTVGPTRLENEFIKVIIDEKNGNITSLVDKRTGREYFGSGKTGNELQCYRDQHEKYDAWNIKLHERLPMQMQGPTEVVESGPVRVTVRITKTIGKSTFVQYVSLVRGVPQVFARMEVDWHEAHVMAKLAFDLNLQNDTAWYEIPYAAIPRAAVAKTDADRAKWEVSAQKWVSYSDRDGSVGFSLLNNGKYGYDTKGSVMRMSLLRSPKEPDPEADMGRHVIEYAIVPHPGDWREAQMPRRGYEFNNPVITMIEPNHGGTLPAEKSFFGSEPAGVILSSVKRAEDSDAVVLRVYESTGRDSRARIRLPAKPKSVVETNLMEEHPKRVRFRGNMIELPIGHYELKTLKVIF
jgi:alpha-mannosidase